MVALGYASSYPSFTASCAWPGCAPPARRAPGSRAGRASRSTTRRVRRSSGIGSSVTTPPGCDRLRPAGHPGPLRPHPGGAGRGHGPAPSRRGHGRRDAPPRRHRPEVAHRPPGHGDRAGDPRRAGQLRPRGQALRSDRGPLPARRGNRKGAVECGVKYVCGRWWRTMTATSMEEARLGLDRFLSTTGDARLRPPGRYLDPDEIVDGRPWPTVAALADAEVLMALPAALYPATIEVIRTVDDRASVAFRGNRYSVAPGLGGVELTLRHRLGTANLAVFSPAGALMVTHRLAPAGAGTMVRTAEHRAALEAVVLSQFSTARPCDRKANKPPGTAALAEKARLMGPRAADRRWTWPPWPTSSASPSPAPPTSRGRCRHERSSEYQRCGHTWASCA